MKIIPKDLDKVVYIENEQNLVLCAYLKNDQAVDKTNVFNATKKEKAILFEAFVLFDSNNNKIIDKHNVVIENYPTIGYARITNLRDENGDDLELCHYINEDSFVIDDSFVPSSPWWKSHIKHLFSIGALCLAVLVCLLFKPQKKTQISTPTSSPKTSSKWTPTIEFNNNLATNGNLSFTIPKGVKAKMYVTSNLNADIKSVDWDKINDTITAKDTLYPKRDCKIFIHAYSDKASENTYTNYEFVFDMKEFLHFFLLQYDKDKELDKIAKFMLNNVSTKLPITFDIGGSLELVPITSIENCKSEIQYMISQYKDTFKIDSVAFYPFAKPIKGATIFSKEYPSIKYIRLK